MDMVAGEEPTLAGPWKKPSSRAAAWGWEARGRLQAAFAALPRSGAAWVQRREDTSGWGVLGAASCQAEKVPVGLV